MADIIDAANNMLDKINEQLEGITAYIDSWAQYIQTELNNAAAFGQEQAQQVINEKMDELSEKITEKLQPVRDKIVNIFKAQIQEVKAKLDKYTAPIKPFVTIDYTSGTVTPNVPADPSELVEVVKAVILMLVPSPAVEFAIRFQTEVFPRIQQLSDNIQTLAAYQPNIQPPAGIDITIPALAVNIEPITLADIMG